MLFPALLAFVGLQSPQPHLLTTPAIHGDLVAFSCEGDLWVGSATTGVTQRLTTDAGTEDNPHFSPDGKSIAFTGSYDGGADAYLIPATGGVPQRLTFDPTGATVEGWTPDGKQVIFRSRKQTPFAGFRLYEVPISGGMPTPLPMPTAAQITYSPDGQSLAYVRLAMEQHHWKRYHGGQANSITVYNIASHQYRRIDDETINEQWPAWTKSGLYYISEKDGSSNVWRFDPATNRRTRITNHAGLDVRWLSTDGQKLVYRFGSDLYTYSPETRSETKLNFTLTTDRIHTRPTYVPGTAGGVELGPTGKRLLALDRGQLFSLGAEKGEPRPVAPFLGSATKSMAWAPDGSSIAFVSDRPLGPASGTTQIGEDNVWIQPSDESLPAQRLTQLEGMPLSDLKWSPDSKSILLLDFANELRLLNVATKKLTTVSTAPYGFNGYNFSPDSKWIVFSSQVGTSASPLFLYNVSSGKTTQIDEPPFKDHDPVFDPSGKYLYFASDRHFDPKPDAFDWQLDFTGATQVYALSLATDTPSPLPTTSDEETVASAVVVTKSESGKPESGKPESGKPESGKPEPAKPVTEAATKIDLAGLAQRLVELPIPAGNIKNLTVSDEKLLFQDDDELKVFTIEKGAGKVTKLADGVSGYTLSGDGKKQLVVRGTTLTVNDAGSPVEGTTAVPLGEWKVRVDPIAEWKETFDQAWRNQRDLFYDPAHHGQDWQAVYTRYSALLPSIGSRNELNEVIGEMIGEMNASHEFAGGGFDRVAKGTRPALGSLGADLAYDAAAHAFKFSRIYPGDGYDLGSRSPLLAPGLGIHEGTYLLAIDGQPLSAEQDPNALLIDQSATTVRLTIRNDLEGGKPGASTTVRVKTLASDATARYYGWVADHRAYVALKAGPTIAYLHMPDMVERGMVELTKWLYANSNKDGLILDVRYNQGGSDSAMVLERLSRVIYEYDQGRYGALLPFHPFGIPGRIVVLCNEETSSDGEYFCTGFRYMKLGSTVGTRTWGGFMAVNEYPTVDGGYVSTPIASSFSPEGKWFPDGTGFTPDYEVPEDPAKFDAQLDKAIEVLKAEIAKHPVVRPTRQTPPTRLKLFPPNRG